MLFRRGESCKRAIISADEKQCAARYRCGRWHGDAGFWQVGEPLPALAGAVAPCLAEIGADHFSICSCGYGCAAHNVKRAIVRCGAGKNSRDAWDRRKLEPCGSFDGKVECKGTVRGGLLSGLLSAACDDEGIPGESTASTGKRNGQRGQRLHCQRTVSQGKPEAICVVPFRVAPADAYNAVAVAHTHSIAKRAREPTRVAPFSIRSIKQPDVVVPLFLPTRPRHPAREIRPTGHEECAAAYTRERRGDAQGIRKGTELVPFLSGAGNGQDRRSLDQEERIHDAIFTGKLLKGKQAASPLRPVLKSTLSKCPIILPFAAFCGMMVRSESDP